MTKERTTDINTDRNREINKDGKTTIKNTT